MDGKRTQSEYWSPAAWRDAQRNAQRNPPRGDETTVSDLADTTGSPAPKAPARTRASKALSKPASSKSGALKPLRRVRQAAADRWVAFSRWFARLPRPMAAALLLATLLICTLSGSLAYDGISRLYASSFARYQADLAIAHDATAHLQVAEADLQQLLKQSPLDTARISQAHDEMQAAHADFVRLNADLASIPGIATLMPKYGPLLSAGQHLLPIALDATQAGVLGLTDWGIVASRLHDPLDPTASGLSADDLKTLQHDAPQLAAYFNDAVTRINALQPSDLQVDPRLGPVVNSLRANLPQIQSAVRAYTTLIALAPGLLGVGQPSNYLVEILDSTELRPGGGFIGNFGILTLTGGRMTSLHVQDVDLLDAPYRGGTGSYYIPLPPQYSWFYGDNRWGFRDSNLDADFPTSAKNGEQLYAREGGTTQLQGVIAITPQLFANLLTITGPINVPEFQDTVTADNLIEKIHYHQLTSSGVTGPGDSGDTNGTSFRKRFTADLFQHFLEQVKAQSSGHLSQFARVLADGTHTKDLQIYLNSAPAEQLLQQYHLADVIEAPSSGDSLFVVESNDDAIKANNWFTYTYSDSVTLDASGTATHHMTLAVAWPANPASLTLSYPSGPPGTYFSYMRVYVPPKAQLMQQSGWRAHPATTAFGRQVWGGEFFVNYGKTTTLNLTWKLPGAASHDDSGWHYTQLVQKQAGITYPLGLSVALPSCASVATPPAGLKVAGHTLSGALPLASDTTTTLNYTLSSDSCK